MQIHHHAAVPEPQRLPPIFELRKVHLRLAHALFPIHTAVHVDLPSSDAIKR